MVDGWQERDNAGSSSSPKVKLPLPLSMATEEEEKDLGEERSSEMGDELLAGGLQPVSHSGRVGRSVGR